MGKQDQADVSAMSPKRLFIGFANARLADGGRRLKIVDGHRALVETEPTAAFGHRTARYHHHAPALDVQVGDLSAPAVEGVCIDALAASGKQGAADLDHPQLRTGQQRAHRFRS